MCSFNIVIHQVSCGEEHTAFIGDPSRHVYTMGSNTDGKLGIGERTLRQSNVPCLVEGLEGIKKVACGMSHTVAVGDSGEVWVWGQGFYGALGLGDSRTVDRPARNGGVGERAVDIGAGSRHTVWVGDSGKVWACGESKQG